MDGRNQRKTREPEQPLLDGYRALAGVYDEMVDPTGAPRPA